jgi:DEAD/DEAH box helicase
MARRDELTEHTSPRQVELRELNNSLEEPELALETTTSDQELPQSLPGDQPQLHSSDPLVTPAVESLQDPISTEMVPPSSAEPLVGATLPQSRKRHDLDNDEQRAKYMAEFHARPMEIDRRSGATGRFTESRDSQHLFQADAQLPLHPRLLLQCQTKFNMKQPTQIQIDTWRQFHAKQQDHNLFVQSETGSGKTLAYLLPIIQVGSARKRIPTTHRCLCYVSSTRLRERNKMVKT